MAEAHKHRDMLMKSADMCYPFLRVTETGRQDDCRCARGTRTSKTVNVGSLQTKPTNQKNATAPGGSGSNSAKKVGHQLVFVPAVAAPPAPTTATVSLPGVAAPPVPTPATVAENISQAITEDGFISFREIAGLDGNDITSFAQTTTQTQGNRQLTHDREMAQTEGKMIFGLLRTHLLKTTVLWIPDFK
jgi:hypothetical protein